MKVSIIGLHAEFADANHIDRFERFIYQGKAAGHVRVESVYNSSYNTLCELARQLQMQCSELDAIIVCDKLSATDENKLAKKVKSLRVVAHLYDAIEFATHNELLAVVGVHQPKTAQLAEKNTLSFAADFDAYSQGAGVCGVLLASAAFCKRHLAYEYAAIWGLAKGVDVAETVRQALAQADCAASDIAYVETSALADVKASDAETYGLIKAYQACDTLHTAIGGLRSITGDAAGFSQVAGLVKTVLVLHQRYIPGIADWQTPKNDAWAGSAFYMPCESRPWFHQGSKPAMAAYSCMSNDQYCHVIVAENSDELQRSNGYLANSDLAMVLVSAADESDLFNKLAQLKQSLTTQSLRAIAENYYQTFLQQQGTYTLCLLAENLAELEKEMSLADIGVHEAFAKHTEWKTPKGSYFTAEPIGGEGGITFLYPGIGATYVGLGREIFHLFPEIWQPVVALADNIGESLKDRILNPRSISRLGFHEIKAIDHDLRNNLASIAECGVGFACVFTKTFEQVFGLKADFATGYSMGEISMYAALGCWAKPGVMSKRLADSDTFNHRLTGELQTLRQHWGLPEAQPGQIEQLWETYTLKATAEEIAEAAADEDRVYCTIINTPDSLVIGGDPAACQRVIKKLGVRAMPLDMPNAIHSPPAFKEYRHMEELYTMDVKDRVDTKLYSSSCYLPVPQRSKAIANSIAKCLCDPVDFPRLINAMYDKGARVFLEMGPGRSLCSWVEKILKQDENRPHVSVPVNAKGTSDELTILRAIAKLVSHGVKVDLSKLYYGSLLAHSAMLDVRNKN